MTHTRLCRSAERPTSRSSPPAAVDDADDCTAPGEFTDPDGAACYLIGATLSGWRDARDLCQAWGGDLAKVESVEENTLLADHSDDDVWLGASDFEDEGDANANVRRASRCDSARPTHREQPLACSH